MKYCHRTIQPIVLALVLTASRGLAGTPELTPTAAPAAENLTLGNLFSQGWDSPYALRESLPDGAPDLPLFHTATNFLVRASRTDYSFQNDLEKSPIKSVNFLDEYLDYAVNQRLMVTVFGNYTWEHREVGGDIDNGGAGAAARFELISTPTSSDCLNLRVDLPDKELGVTTTKLSATIAGWQDLSPLGVGRLGLYYSLEEDAYAGNETAGTMRDALSYDVAIAQTWTKGTAPVAYLTTFVEFAGGTNMDGNQRTYTNMTATPGVQFIVGKRNVIMLGVDFPLTHPSAEVNVYRATYIYLF
jgi:hypothetical protein